MRWIKRLQKPVLFFGVGIDVESQPEIKKIQKIFSYKKAEITVRDMQSFFTLSELGISAEVIDDPVFMDHDSGSR
jgi:polysaccharide pyruvyl transferase WcaK-like protein